MTTRDDLGQYDGEWTEREYRLLCILEDVATPEERDVRTLAVFLADIIDLFSEIAERELVE